MPVVSTTVQSVSSSVPPTPVLTSSVVPTIDSHRFRSALRSVVSSYGTIHSCPLAHAFTALSASIPGSTAVTAGLVAAVDSPRMVTVTSFFRSMLSSYPASSALVRDLDDEE